ILNSLETGQPTAIMESSVFGTKRTAASAALAARYLWVDDSLKTVGLIGCGPINYEILRFLLAVYPMIETVHLFNRSRGRAESFRDAVLHKLNANLTVQIEDTYETILRHVPIVSFGTTTKEPYIHTLTEHAEHAVFLHVSLYDFAPDIILKADNVADDIGYVCNHRTSVHLAEQQVGHRAFMRTEMGHIANGDTMPRDLEKPFAIYSPVGLAILDVAVALLLQELALEQNVGTIIESFLPKPWLER
ncbi:MAG: 2,3-diaminopropionate biosynthesis protein SbnB, partial [Chloroflexota bacterium]